MQKTLEANMWWEPSIPSPWLNAFEADEETHRGRHKPWMTINYSDWKMVQITFSENGGCWQSQIIFIDRVVKAHLQLQ